MDLLFILWYTCEPSQEPRPRCERSCSDTEQKEKEIPSSGNLCSLSYASETLKKVKAIYNNL